MRLKPLVVRRLFDTQAWIEATFLIFASACFVGFTELYILYFYIKSYALQNKIFAANTAFYLVSILNAGSFLERVVSLHTLPSSGKAACFAVFSHLM